MDPSPGRRLRSGGELQPLFYITKSITNFVVQNRPLISPVTTRPSKISSSCSCSAVRSAPALPRANVEPATGLAGLRPGSRLTGLAGAPPGSRLTVTLPRVVYTTYVGIYHIHRVHSL